MNRDPLNFFTGVDVAASTEAESKHIAERLNSILREHVGPKVFANEEHRLWSGITSRMDTHEAVLFCVKEVGSE